MHDDDDDNGDSIIKRVFLNLTSARRSFSRNIFYIDQCVSICIAISLSKKREKKRRKRIPLKNRVPILVILKEAKNT